MKKIGIDMEIYQLKLIQLYYIFVILAKEKLVPQRFVDGFLENWTETKRKMEVNKKKP